MEESWDSHVAPLMIGVGCGDLQGTTGSNQDMGHNLQDVHQHQHQQHQHQQHQHQQHQDMHREMHPGPGHGHGDMSHDMSQDMHNDFFASPNQVSCHHEQFYKIYIKNFYF